MKPGQRILGRFEIEREAGSGGMGTVYRALDRRSGEPVAVKVLRDRDSPEAPRFTREARLLSELRHPCVVQYVASGTTEEGAPYLVMEWLEGEDLRARLARTGLSLPEAVDLGRRVAEGLSAVHAQGAVHRDIKPSNIFLCGGLVDRIKVVDFGIAHVGVTARALTHTASMMGTPGYMAPEQVRGDRSVDARADVFSLGCVLYRCLAGQAAFAGDDVLAVLTKVLLEEVPRLREQNPLVPPPLEALVTRMLAKDPARRPAGGAAVAAELGALPPIAAGGRPHPITSIPTSRLTDGEQRLVSVALVGADVFNPSSGAAFALPPPATVDTVTRSRTAPAHAETDGALAALVAEHGGRVERLADGTLVVTLASEGAATAHATRAARCALALRAALPGRGMALATGRGKLGARWPAGEAIDRAARLFQKRPDPDRIRVDELTAGLLDARFAIEGGAEAEGLLLCGLRDAEGPARTLLGRSTACVGRERELRALGELYDECASEPAARAVLVTGEPGIGKSRVRVELEARVRARTDGAEVWVARGDPMRAGASFGLLAQLLRTTARLVDGEPRLVREQKLRARVGRHVDPAAQPRVAELLGELVGVPFPDGDSVELRAARASPRLRGDQMRRAFVDFLAAECAAHPVVLVLDDLQWGDHPTVAYLDAALRLLGARPLLVAAFARPGVHDAFPHLWADRPLTELRLGELSRRASEELAQQVLGKALSPDQTATLCERAAGNAFFLEELLRAAAEGRGEPVPLTARALVEARLAALDPESRRVLCAGSVFGEVFWQGAVEALVGGRSGLLLLDERLDRLEEQEWIAARADGRFHGEREYVFRHALVREAAHAALPEPDRALAHGLAAEWLARVGETDATAVAEHLHRSPDPAAAAPWLHRAAEQALEGDDLCAALARAERAAAFTPPGEPLAALHLLRAEAHRWRGEHALAEARALDAMAHLAPRADRWFAALREAAAAAAGLGRHDRLATLAALLAPSALAPTPPAVAALAQTATWLLLAGALPAAEPLLARLDHLERTGALPLDPVTRALVDQTFALRALHAGDPARYRDLLQAAIRRCEEAGDLRGASGHRVNAGWACNELGAYAEAAAQLGQALTEATRMGLRNVAAGAQSNLCLALARTGMLEEARALAAEAIETFSAQADRRLEGGTRIYLVAALTAAGDLSGAEAQAERAVETLAAVEPLLPFALATLARVLLSEGEKQAGVARAAEAIQLLRELGRVDEGETTVRLVHAEALAAIGDRPAARAAIASARDHLLARAARIADPPSRLSYLDRVPEHARTLALARALLDTG